MKSSVQNPADSSFNQAISANQFQINDYNYLRKSKTFYESNNRQNINKIKSSYQHLGNIMDLKNNWQQIKSLKPDLNLKESFNLPDSEHYRAANGTQYKTGNINGFQTTIVDYPSKNVIHVPGKYHELYRSNVELHEIPQNIRHKFGTKQTENLLSDKVKVHDALSQIQNSGIIKKHNKANEDEQAKKEESNKTTAELIRDMANVSNSKKFPGKDYYDLGHSICHGYPSLNTVSTTKSSYSESVSIEHLSDQSNYDSPYRRKKDWLGKWTEQSLVSKRISQELNKTFAERAKAKSDAKV